MFWAETVKDRYKFCTCEGSWKNFKIINTDVTEDLLLFSMTPLDGNKCLIFSQRKNETLPSNLDLNFTFKPFQHVKVQAYGGHVVIVGQAHEGTTSSKNNNCFPSNCPFGDEDDWGRRERISSRKPRFSEKGVETELIATEK